MVQATKDENLDSIIEKILSQDSINSKFSVYSMFYITHIHYIPEINTLLQLKDPDLWNLIRKSFYPTILDKMTKLKFLVNKQNLIILMLILSLFSNIYMFIIFENHINSNTNENRFNVQKSKIKNKRHLKVNEASGFADEANTSAEEASGSVDEAGDYATDAQNYMNNAEVYMNTAEDYMNTAEEYMNNAAQSAKIAEEYANNQ